MADTYVGYLPSFYNIASYNTNSASNTYSGVALNTKIVLLDYTNNAQNLVKMQVAPFIANFIPNTFVGINNQIGTVLATDDFRNIAPIKMTRLDVVPLQADFVPLTFNGLDKLVGTIIVGLKNNAEFSGIIPGAGNSETKYIYRTVGSPRRTPLESSWLKSKNEEPIIIDEVDGDVDE